MFGRPVSCAQEKKHRGQLKLLIIVRDLIIEGKKDLNISR